MPRMTARRRLIRRDRKTAQQGKRLARSKARLGLRISADIFSVSINANIPAIALAAVIRRWGMGRPHSPRCSTG